jgi:peptide/nickel transport system substrate-binding protein
MRAKQSLLVTLAVVCLGTASAGRATLTTETPKHGGTLTYMIPADAPPSLDGHREATYATIHAVAPFYSVLMRVNPANPAGTTNFVCDLCLEVPKPTGDGKTYTFKIRQGVRFQDGTPLTAADVAASWHEIIFPRPDVLSARQNWYSMVDSVISPDDTTVVFKLKYATTAFFPALADPYGFIYEKKILDTDPHWYETHVMGSGSFHFVDHTIGQSIEGVRDPDYYHKGEPYLDGFKGLFAPRQPVRVDAIRADRAAIEFRGPQPSARDELTKDLGDKVTVQTSDWNCGNLITPNSSRKPFDDVRVRRALLLAINQWQGGPALSKLAGFWPDIEKSRAEARRLLKEAGAEGLSFELLNRNVDQWSKIGVHATQKVVPTGPWFAAMRGGDFDVVVEANCNSIVNPVLDTQKYLPHDVFVENYGYYKDPVEADIYNKMLHEVDPAKQRVLMRAYEKQIIDTEAHEFPMLWWERIMVYQSYVKGWKIGPSHYINQDLADIWLDR